MARRALFGIGDCHIDAENMTEAQRVFQMVQVQHRRTVEGFFACSRLAKLVEVFRTPPAQAESAREVAIQSIRLLQEDLNEMKKDHEVFALPGVPSRDQWVAWAEATRNRLTAAPKTDRPLPSIR